MNKNILVFIPNTLSTYKTGYIEGCYKKFENCEAFYITSDLVSNYSEQCIGYIGKSVKNSKCTNEPYLFINNSNKKVLVNSGCYPFTEIVYDYRSFKNSDISSECNDYGKHFTILSQKIRKHDNETRTNGRRGFISGVTLIIILIIDTVLKVVLLYSDTFIHFEESTRNLRWFLNDVLTRKKVSPKTGNLLVAKLIDLTVGIVLLNLCLKYENDILNYIHTCIEDIIINLKSLLLYLMGSPIGLKLNHCFNNTLGKFFFYHITLWRVFLQGTEPLLRAYFKYLVLPGALGFSFQIAMFSDIISIATFHVYCIYVYAARLFSLQIRGLTSLWRLFIGRKLNPLRERVDSCKYTPDQLFIGTLGFTILLFLLPTATMYYAVFTIFRVAILVVNGLLLRARFILNTLPLYVLFLWIFNSSSIAGTIYVDLKNEEETENVTLEAKLKTLSLKTSLTKFIPDSIKPVEGKSFSYIIHSIFTGVLL